MVLRGENASDADNNLTMDDASESKDIYSGDFVKKQAAQFIKLEDLSTETGKEPIEAGFSMVMGLPSPLSASASSSYFLIVTSPY